MELLARRDPQLLLMLDLKGRALRAPALLSVLAAVAHHRLQRNVAVWCAPSPGALAGLCVDVRRHGLSGRRVAVG